MVVEIRSKLQDAVKKYGDRSRQQIFLSKDALLFYYSKYYTYSDSNDHYDSAFSRTFVRVPYTAEYSISGKTISFSGDLCKIELQPEAYAVMMDAEEAETCGQEAALQYMNPGKSDGSEKLVDIVDPEIIRQITEAFAAKSVNLTDSVGIHSWRILLDRYLTEKRENLDTADTVIQTYWFADYLARRRQTRLGVKASQIFIPKGKIEKKDVFVNKQGRCSRTSVTTKGEMRYSYGLGDDHLEFSTKMPPVFSILATEDPKESRICPNCGTEVKTEEAVNGCPSCGTYFRLTDYDYKVSGESLSHTKLNIVRFMFGTFGITILLTILINILTSPPQPLALLILQGAFTGAMLGIFVYFVLCIPIAIVLMTRVTKRMRFPTFANGLRKKDPQMSPDEFEAEVQSRIRAFFLSESTDDIRFVSGAAPGQFTDVVDVRIKEYRRIALVPNPNFQIVRAHVIVDLIRVKNQKLVREEAKFSFDIYRAAVAKTELKTEKEIFTCPSCASSLSILDGGHCKFCGKTSELSRYGWVLGAVMAE